MTEIRVVPDTNIVISAIFWKGSPYKVIRRGLEKKLTLVISHAIVEEVVDKLTNKFDVPEERIGRLVDILISYSDVVEPSINLDVVKADEKDNKILECAVEGKADYILSGDRHLLRLKEYKGIKIITASEFLKVIERKF